MNHPDLFGGETPANNPGPPYLSPYQKFKIQNNYRRSANKLRRCKTCKFITFHEYNRKYYKCQLIGESNSAATDIAIGHVCDKWESG